MSTSALRWPLLALLGLLVAAAIAFLATRAVSSRPSRVPTIMPGARVPALVSSASTENHGGSGVVCSSAYFSTRGSMMSMSVMRVISP